MQYTSDYGPNEIRNKAYDALQRELDADTHFALEQYYKQADQLHRKIATADGYLDYLSNYINREYTKLQAFDKDRPQDHPYDGERTQPMCGCADRYCPLKEGRLPREIRISDNPLEALREFKNSHPGDPYVLISVSDRYDELYATVIAMYRRIYLCGKYRIHPDELEEEHGYSVDPREDERETGTVATGTMGNGATIRRV